MNYKMIAIDLDGTLLDDDKRVDKENIEVLNTLRDMGMEIVIATGRRDWSAKNFAKELKFPATLLVNNGYSAWSMDGDRRIFSRYIDQDKFYELAELGSEYGVYPIIHVDHFEEGHDFLLHHHPSSGYYKNYVMDDEERYMVCPDLREYKNPRALAI